MSSVERDPETLELFIEESMEGLTRVERLLLAAEEGTAPADLMARLFRDMHTIKGTSGFLALPKILGLAHAAEDLLSELREGTFPATKAHLARLVEVVDLLRKMVESTRDTGDEGAFDVSGLVRALAEMAAHGPAAAEPVPALGELLVDKNVISSAQLDAALARQAQATPKLGEVLVDDLAVSKEQIDEALAEQDRARRDQPIERSDGTVRVSVGVLDRLMNLIGELVLARNQLAQSLRTTRESQPQVQAAVQRLGHVSSDLQEQVMKTRMQPVSRVFERIPRMVRDLSTQTGKLVGCRIEGNATEIDKALVEAIRDPVMHMIRNAIDHGIESAHERALTGKPQMGTLSVRAAHEGGSVLIEIQDDGRGMDPAKLRAHAVARGVITAAEAGRLSDADAVQLVFRPGFSTAEAVTDLSGRGVGMDVVRTHVEGSGGQVELESVVGKGTTIRLRMPLTLAIIPALLVRAGTQRFAIPQASLLELVHLDEEAAAKKLEQVHGAPIYRLRGEVLPLVSLSQVLRIHPAAEGLGGSTAVQTFGQPAEAGITIVVVLCGSQRYGLVVDGIEDTEEIVVKPLHPELKRLACYSGATVLGDGSVSLILEAAGVAAMAGIDVASIRQQGSVERARENTGGGTQPFVLFEAGAGVRCVVPLGMLSRLEIVAANTLEKVGPLEVLQYRDQIVPIVRPEAVLPFGAPPASDMQPLLVFELGDVVAMAVTAIIDIVELPNAEGMDPYSLPFTHGKRVVSGRTTLVLDAFAVAKQLVPGFGRERARVEPTRVLVVEDSVALRSALVSHLRAQGFIVSEAHDGNSALAALRGASAAVDAVVTDIEMPGMDGWGLLTALRRERPTLPTFVWTFLEGPAILERARSLGARSCIHKLQRDELATALLAVRRQEKAA